jgi:hypothetical protein
MIVIIRQEMFNMETEEEKQHYSEMVAGVSKFSTGLRLSRTQYKARCGLCVFLHQACPRAGTDKKEVCPKTHNRGVLTMACLTGEKVN